MPGSPSDPPELARFGEKLHALRLRRKLTVAALAHALGYAAHTHLSLIESGQRRPNRRLVQSVAQYFGVAPDVLLRDDLEVGAPGPVLPAAPAPVNAPAIAGSRTKKIEVGLDEALYAQAQQYAKAHSVSISALIRAWLRRHTDPKALLDLPYGVARELSMDITRKTEVRLEPELWAQAHRYARRHMTALAPIIRAWLRYHTNPRSPGPLPPGIDEEREQPARGAARR